MKTTTRPHQSPDQSLTARERGQIQSLTFQERASLTLSVVALALAGIAIGALVTVGIFLPSFVDAKVQSGIAKAEASAHDARVDSRVALDKVEEIRVQLASKGIVTKIE